MAQQGRHRQPLAPIERTPFARPAHGCGDDLRPGRLRPGAVGPLDQTPDHLLLQLVPAAPGELVTPQHQGRLGALGRQRGGRQGLAVAVRPGFARETLRRRARQGERQLTPFQGAGQGPDRLDHQRIGRCASQPRQGLGQGLNQGPEPGASVPRRSPLPCSLGL